MKGKEINAEFEKESDEVRAKRVILDIQKIIADRKEEVTEAEEKLAEVLEKDIADISEKDARSYDW